MERNGIQVFLGDNTVTNLVPVLVRAETSRLCTYLVVIN